MRLGRNPGNEFCGEGNLGMSLERNSGNEPREVRTLGMNLL